MSSLLPLMKRDIRVVALKPYDWSAKTDSVKDFRRLVLESRDSYPRISDWLDKRVFNEVGTASRRVALLAYDGDTPAATAVLKVGVQTKICHLKVASAYNGRRVGDLLFSLMITRASPIAQSVYFTLPESLWESQGGFFKTFGFERAGRSFRQYRRADEELVSRACFSQVWQSTLDKLPGLANSFSILGSDIRPSIMLSVHPQFADQIIHKKKHFEIRTRFSKRWIGHRAAIYATSPVRSVVGEVDIESVDYGSPDMIWERYSESLGCSREEYDAYTRGRIKVFAIGLSNVLPYERLVRLDQLVSEKISPPQAYCRLIDASPLTKAALTASLVHASASVPK